MKNCCLSCANDACSYPPRNHLRKTRIWLALSGVVTSLQAASSTRLTTAVYCTVFVRYEVTLLRSVSSPKERRCPKR